MLKQIEMFKEMHISVLTYFCTNCVKVNILNNGDLVKMKNIISDMDYIYVYRGKIRIKIEHNFGKMAPKGGSENKLRYSVMERGEFINP